MCEFVSWIEYEGKNYFITETDLQTKEGRELLKQYNNNIYHKDIVGHGFIRAYYPELKGRGINREYTDFSSPANFPPEIVEQIKAGNMKFRIIEALLKEQGLAKYREIRGSAWAKHKKIQKQVWTEYVKTKKIAFVKYGKIGQPDWAKYDKIKRQNWVECRKIAEIALVEYEKITRTAFWKLFKIKKNRSKEWK